MLLSRRFVRLNAAALLIGALVGLAVVAFRYVINVVENASFRGLDAVPGSTWKERNEFGVLDWGPWPFLVIFVPAIGGAIVGLIRHFRPDTKQQGVAEVMAAVQAKGGVLRARTSLGHAVISAITVGTGGSTGREGPISYIGAAVGSSIARRLRFNARDLKVLLGGGFAAGIGGTFNAPLGGTILALELIVPEFSTHAFIPLVLAAVAGTLVAHLFLGTEATFLLGGFHFGSPWELLVYLVLGLVCGLGGVAFIRVLDQTMQRWRAAQIPGWSKPIVGGLMVGALGYALYQTVGQYHIFGSGYASITDLLHNDIATMAWLPLLVLVVAKPFATSITIGSGGGGGVFSASLFQGAVLGGLVGLAAYVVIDQWLGFLTIDPASYALVGMGAFYAATARATLTAIVIMTELTNDFTILLPLMFTAVVADAVSVGLSRDSVYTVRLTEKGILYEHDRLQSPLDLLQVRQVMSTKVDTLPGTTNVGDAFARMLDLGHTGYPVADAEGRLVGVVTRRDLSRHLQEGRGQSPLVDVVSGVVITALPDEMLHRARDRMFGQRVGRLVVVDPMDRRRVVGILTRSDLLRAEAERDVGHQDAFAGGNG